MHSNDKKKKTNYYDHAAERDYAETIYYKKNWQLAVAFSAYHYQHVLVEGINCGWLLLLLLQLVLYSNI